MTSLKGGPDWPAITGWEGVLGDGPCVGGGSGAHPGQGGPLARSRRRVRHSGLREVPEGLQAQEEPGPRWANPGGGMHTYGRDQGAVPGEDSNSVFIVGSAEMGRAQVTGRTWSPADLANQPPHRFPKSPYDGLRAVSV